jgi:hypothetical protein
VNPLTVALAALLAVAPAIADPPPHDYCKQDPDWYLCQKHQEPPRT